MANKKSKDYSVGNPKKGLTLLAIVVLIAIIIVLIIIFIPANTSNAKEILHNVTSTSYLQDKEEITSYEKIGEKLQNSTKNYYMEEYNNVPILSSTIDKVLEFYDEYLVFAKDNKVLSNNYSAIKKNLNKVISQQKKLNNIVKNVVNLEQDSDSYLQNLWIDYREEYANWLEYNANAISALSKCYEGCFENTLTNNKASKIVLDTIISERLTSNGFVPEEELSWLDKELDDAKKDTVLIFMHVPIIEPFPSSGHRLLNAAAVQGVIEKHKNPIAVFAGHYHAAKITQNGNVLYVASPALVSYPNAFRIITVRNQWKKVVFNIEMRETREKNIQKLAKLLVFGSNVYTGEEKDRNGVYEIKKN